MPDEAEHESLQTETANLLPEAIYVHFLILGMYHDPTEHRMIAGQGNFGTPHRGMPAAHPACLDIWLTDRALSMIRTDTQES